MVHCPKCGAERVYMGSMLAILETSKRPIRIQCGKCGARIKINPGIKNDPHIER